MRNNQGNTKNEHRVYHLRLLVRNIRFEKIRKLNIGFVKVLSTMNALPWNESNFSKFIIDLLTFFTFYKLLIFDNSLSLDLN